MNFQKTLVFRFFVAFALLVGLNPGQTSSAQNAVQRDVKKLFSAEEYESPTGKKLLYRFLKPHDFKAGEKSDKKYPLVVFLHGAGERGDDNTRQLVHGMKDFSSKENMEKYPAFVIAPQCPKGKRWVEVEWSADRHTMPKKPSETMRLTLQLIDQVIKDFPVDRNRIYVTGLSMGGFGTFDMICRRPKLFAAASPICGGGDSRTEIARTIKHIPIWVVHGDKDRAVKVSRSREMVASLKAASGKPKYTELKGVGHNSWSATYSDPEFYKWLFTQRKKDK